jgi:hypothetical protein
MKRYAKERPAVSIKEFFSTEKEINQLEWKEIYTITDLHPEYVPQGMAVHEDTLYHTVHKHDKKSVLIIFNKKDATLRVIKEIVLPLEATHTSDLTLYKGHFYAIDYHSNQIYQYDFAELRTKLVLKLVKKVRVTKDGRRFGSMEIIDTHEREYLVVTSFLNDNRMYVFDFDKFFRQALGFEKSLEFSTEASYFTQGLYYHRTRGSLFHSVNRFDVDFIYELDTERLLQTKNYHQAIRRTFLAPSKMVEDIAVQDTLLYTSDESTSKLYVADLANVTVRTDYDFNDVRKAPYYDKLLSHRARVWDFQENTLDAFVEVLSTRIKYIEIDVRFSSDNVGYVYHDSFFTDGTEKFRFSEKTWAEVEEYRYLHKDIRITKFEDLVLHFATHKKPGQYLAIDLKDFGYEQYIFDLCARHGILDSVLVFTWTPQVIFEFDRLFTENGQSFPLYFSHVRVDSMFKYFFIPAFLNYRNFFVSFFDFVLIGNTNYKQPLGKYEKGYRHVPYFARLPDDLVAVLKKYSGGVCVTKKSYRWGDSLLKRYKAEGLKIAIFGAFFGLVKIDTQKAFEYEARKDYVDIVFMDDLSRITISDLESISQTE